jgi:hypothetical protein
MLNLLLAQHRRQSLFLRGNRQTVEAIRDSVRENSLALSILRLGHTNFDVHALNRY